MRLGRQVGATVVVAGILAVGAIAGATVSPRGVALSLSFSNAAPEQHVKISAKVCTARADRGWKALVEEQEGTAKAWRAIGRGVLARATGCITIPVNSGTMGSYKTRALVESGTKVEATTPDKPLKVYRHVGASVLVHNVFEGANCGENESGTVTTSGHTLPFVFSLCSGDNLQAAGLTSCRSMTFQVVSTDSASGDPSSPGTSTLQLTQARLNEQNNTFNDNHITSWVLRLDGSQWELTYTNTNESALYFLTSGTWADCTTPTGIA